MGLTVNKTASAALALALAAALPNISVARTSSEIIADARAPMPHEEVMLLEAIENWHQGETDVAISSLAELITRRPNYRLARVLHNDLLRAKAGKATLVAHIPSETDDLSLAELLAEIKARWNHHIDAPDSSSTPSSILRMSSNQTYAIAVDLSRSRLYLFENVDGKAVLLQSFYSGIGKGGWGKERQGDLKTPIGVYFVVDQLDDSELPDLYGAGAFPVSYPNILDQRRGRTGGGIWLHGVPRDTYVRAPQSSRGCVTMANDDFTALSSFVDVNRTPVILADSLEWVSEETQAQSLAEFETVLNQWVLDWESRDPERYLAHYHSSFQGQGMGYEQWAAYKDRVNTQKLFIDVEVGDLSAFHDPREDVMVVRFFQRYRSNTFASDARKLQYWRRNEQGRWQIIHEDHVPGTSLTTAEVPESMR